MNKVKQIILSGVACAVLAWTASTNAAIITCEPQDERKATLTSAEQCKTGLGNPKLADIQADYPGDPWSNQGELTSNGTDGYLSVQVFNAPDPYQAFWAIAAEFWTLFDEAVISIHVGNGNGDPDYFAWLITPGETSGAFQYEDLDGRGGGLSNVKLWGRGEGGTTVAEPNTLMLLGVGLLALGALHRKQGKQA